jgi:dTDP-glucose 4,6-dehydratase
MVTGGAGFIGSNFIRHILKKDHDIEVVNVDILTYAGNLKNLKDVEKQFSNRYTFFRGDVCDRKFISSILETHRIDVLINFAAESHVDRSIMDSDIFVKTNIIGTKTLLDAALDAAVPLFIQISTDEVYGSLDYDGKFTEKSVIAPNSPYAASKAAADHLVRAYSVTYELPVIITRCSNNYGPYQFPEKFIPLMILNAIENKPLPVYGNGENIRDWIHVEDHSSALYTVMSKGKPGEVYNIGGNCEKQNVDVTRTILDVLSKPQELITFVTDRPGHDLRYAMDYSKLQNSLGWEPKVRIEEGLHETIKWYSENTEWIQSVKTRDYLTYYEKQYGSER